MPHPQPCVSPVTYVTCIPPPIVDFSHTLSQNTHSQNTHSDRRSVNTADVRLLPRCLYSHSLPPLLPLLLPLLPDACPLFFPGVWSFLVPFYIKNLFAFVCIITITSKKNAQKTNWPTVFLPRKASFCLVLCFFFIDMTIQSVSRCRSV